MVQERSPSKPIETQRDVQVELQKFVQRPENSEGLGFTQGAAEYLSKAAADSIVKSISRRGVPGKLEDAKSSFSEVAGEIHKFATSQRIDLKEVKRLRAQERFCNIRPWC